MRSISIITVAASIWVAGTSSAGDITVDGTFVSTAASGTPPLQVSSSTHVENLNADLLDGLSSEDLSPADHQHAQYASYVRTVVVSPYLDGTGNQDPVASGAVLLAALAAITTATEVNPYLLKLEPGIFDLDQESLAMKEWVDIEGSGRNMTTIRSRVGTLGGAVVLGADNAELRSLGVVHLGGGDDAYAIFNDHVSPRLIDMRVVASGGSDHNVGIRNEYSQAHLERISVEAAGGDWACGVSSVDSSITVNSAHVEVSIASPGLAVGISDLGASSFPIMTDITVTAVGGNATGIETVANGHLRDVMVSVSGDSGLGGITIGGDLVLSDVEITVAGGTSTAGVAVEYGSSATLSNLSILASGASNVNWGIALFGCSATIKGMSVAAVGGVYAFGVDNAFSSSSTITEVTASAAGASSYNYAVYNEESSTLKIANLNARGSGGAGGFGVYNTGSGDGLTLDSSSVSGSSYSVRNDNAAADVFVGASKLDGAVSSYLTCVASYNGFYSPVTCP